ncbi:very long chain fatty acid elongase 7-like isoform X2 [Rhodnius prolixus]
MASLVSYVTAYYNRIFHEKGDPRSNDLFLMSSPVPMAMLLIGYWYFVTKLGKDLMEHRKPFNLEKVMVIFNVAQSIINGVMGFQGIYYMFDKRFNLACEVVHDSYDPFYVRVVSLMHLYLLIKISDLLDTVFMVLRKNYHQITFLHVYHHIGMALGTWLIVKYLPGGHVCFFGTINCLVHMFMYVYYFLAAKYPSYKSVWWKRNITQLQMLQFFIVLVHHSQALLNPDCEYPKYLLVIFISQNFLMIYLFARFYYKAYLAPKKDKPIDKVKES